MKSTQVLSVAALSAIVQAADNPWATYPSVPKTASINGFADRIYAEVAPCAQSCLDSNKSTGNTPCPYWDTGCLCVMPQWGSGVAECIADACAGEEVVVFTSAAVSLCSSAGVYSPYWNIPSADSALLINAAAKTADATATSESSKETEASSSQPQETAAPSSSDAATSEDATSEDATSKVAASKAASSEAASKDTTAAPASSGAAASSASRASSSAAKSSSVLTASAGAANANFPGLAASLGGVAVAAVAMLI